VQFEEREEDFHPLLRRQVAIVFVFPFLGFFEAAEFF